MTWSCKGAGQIMRSLDGAKGWLLHHGEMGSKEGGSPSK
jgi:hypothetical protein